MNEETEPKIIEAISPAEESAAGSEDTGADATRLTPDEWAKVRAMYESGVPTLAALSAEFGVAKSTISAHFKKHGTTRGSRSAEVTARIEEKVAEKLAEIATTFADKKVQRIEETKNEHYEAARFISKMVNKTLVDAVKDKIPLSAIYNNLKSLRIAQATLAQARQERFEILDVANEIDERDLPHIIFDDLSEKDIAELQARNDDGFDSLELDDIDDEVIIEGEE
jgi:hypothetical protein